MSSKLFPYFFFYVLICGCVAALVSANETNPKRPAPSPPSGEPDAISEWALAGMVWSEACLVNKVATETARRNDLAKSEMDELEAIGRESRQLINQMKSFGWDRIRKSRTDQPSQGQTTKKSRLPDPKSVGAALQQSMGNRRPANERSSRTKPQRDKTQTTEMLKNLEARYDSETPDHRDDPGIDDERMANRIDVDIDQYRVDDYIDETPREARNLADAKEDGVERAIAAASDDGIAGPVAGHISYRESQTRAATLPYAKDSIYDADDYDPDVDYDVDNRLTDRQVGTEEAELNDLDDDISPQDPAEAATGEDELIAAMARGRTGPVEQSSTQPAQASSNLGNRQSKVKNSTRSIDANWVNMHLLLNQNRWDAIKDSGVGIDDARRAAEQLRATMATVAKSSDSKQLRSLLSSNP